MGTLLPRHGSSPCCGQRRYTPDIEGNLQYVENNIVSQISRLVLHLVGFVETETTL
jgi:hypothetical protein